MRDSTQSIAQEIAQAFSLSEEEAKIGCLLLQARAQTLDYTFDEYLNRYHPDGIANRDENLPEEFCGYVQFLSEDAQAVLRAGKGANFSTFVHECAYVFRRQLTGEFQQQAEKAFGVENGLWNTETEELFARGLEQWITLKNARDKTRADVYNKGKSFFNTVYRGMEHIVDIDQRMEKVYQRLFEERKYIFNQSTYEEILKKIAKGKLPEKPHVFLGMTPRIYEELGFQRLPMAITGKHLYSTLRAGGKFTNVNYHDLGDDILKQIPEQLKNPLCIVQDPKNKTNVISVVALKDKGDNQIIIPVAYSQRGNINGTEIDINLTKTIFGKSGFEHWLQKAVEDNRLLYVNKKKTEPDLRGGMGITHNYINADQTRSIRLPDGFRHLHTAGPTTDVFGFVTENVARYKQTVKDKIPERFNANGQRILYQKGKQLTFDFSTPVHVAQVVKAEPLTIQAANEAPKYRELHPFGAWDGFTSSLSRSQRETYNKEILGILEQRNEKPLTEYQKNIVSRYSGFGGIAASGERGVLYDYYTSPPVARLVWQMLDKAGGISAGAKVLEPSCGTGVFFQFSPSNKGLSFTGVELDERTSSIANILNSGDKTEILTMSFEAFNLSDKKGGYDHVIGNAPFGERTAALAALDMSGEKSLDNYFVSRCIDNLKPEGTMALIAAPGVLANSSNEQFRLGINKKAQFIGAVKLSDSSFSHTNTRVMPDILLFRSYPSDIQQRLSQIDDETFKKLPLYNTDFVQGTYYQKHPEHIAGEVKQGSGQWGNDEVKGEITEESLQQVLDNFSPESPLAEEIFQMIREGYQLQGFTTEVKEILSLSEDEVKQLQDRQLKAGAIKIEKGNIYILSGANSWHSVSHEAAFAEKLSSVMAISQSVHEIQAAMKAEKEPGEISECQRQCSNLLSEYQKKYSSLPVDDPDIKRFTREHPVVSGIYESFLTKSDPLLTEPNVYRKSVDLVDGHNQAVSALLQMQAALKEGTEENIASMFPDSSIQLISEMREHSDIFITPEGEYQLREDFISGDAWAKVDNLHLAAETESAEWKKGKLIYGASELEKAVGWTSIEDADFSPRSSWIPEKIVREWASSPEALGNGNLENLAKNSDGKWGTLNRKGEWMEEADPLVYYLNSQKQRSKYFDTDTFNKEHDELFRSFICSHESYRSELESAYNRAFKTHIAAAVKTYPVEIAGWRGAEAGGKTLKGHQWQSVHHLYRNQRGISALGTGFGKTTTAIALMSLLRQEGKSKRVFLQVPNNKVKDWIAEIKDVMPSLKIASIDPEETGYSNRDKRYAKYQAMARSNADIIIMSESSASEIQLSTENDQRVTDSVASRYESEKEGASARQKEKAALKGEYKAQSGKTNATICFEDFGCDALVVDEAHRYKNLFSSTLSRETGLNDGRQSAKAMSLYKKSEYIRGENGGKNVYLLTATPLTNSPLEYYNMMQYIAPEDLRRMGVATIDGFIREFAEIQTGWLYDWGSGLAKQGRVLSGFKNLPTLQNLFFAYTDLQNNPEVIGLEKPGAENKPNIIAKDEKQTEAVKAISQELDLYKSLDMEERAAQFPGENFLTFYTRMRTASLDLELYDPKEYKGWKNPKLENLAKNASDNYKSTKGGQVIFCDRVFSSDASFNIHEKIKKELMAQGFKEKEIVIVNGFTKSGGSKNDSAIEKEVSKAIEDYNSGKYKVIIGTTSCIGEGVNLQKNSSAVHHFDIPFRPSDFIQRNGRIDRQGNQQDKVELHTYLASGTIDNYSVNLVQRKADWIDKLLKTTSPVFTNPNDENAIDSDELQLALTEEWGDKEAAQERREALNRQKEEKIREAQGKQMKAQIKNLSLARGALESLDGKEGSIEYKKRTAIIDNVEKALKSNPAFNRHDILENREPFLYNSAGLIFRKGDIIVTGSGRFAVDSFNFKKQELSCTELLSAGEKHEKTIQFGRYGYNGADAPKVFKVSELLPEALAGRRSYNAVQHHFEKADASTKQMLTTIGGKDFYTLPHDEKEKHYALHINIMSNKSSGFSPIVFSIDGDDGSLKAETARYRYNDNSALNPFSGEGKAAILKALEKGIQYNKYDSEFVETVAATLPELAVPVKIAVAKEQKREELAAKLEAERLKQKQVQPEKTVKPAAAQVSTRSGMRM